MIYSQHCGPYAVCVCVCVRLSRSVSHTKEVGDKVDVNATEIWLWLVLGSADLNTLPCQTLVQDFSGAFEFNTFVYFVTVPVHAVSIPIYFNGSCLARAYNKSRWKPVCETRSISAFIFIKSTQMYPYDLLLPIGFWWTLSHEATTGGPLSCKV